MGFGNQFDNHYSNSIGKFLYRSPTLCRCVLDDVHRSGAVVTVREADGMLSNLCGTCGGSNIYPWRGLKARTDKGEYGAYGSEFK